MTDTNSDVVAITQLLNLYGLAVDAHGVKFELTTTVLRHEADAARVGILAAVLR